MRRPLVILAFSLVALAIASKCRADYALRWWSNSLLFPERVAATTSPISGPILAATNFVADLDGDGELELIGLRDSGYRDVEIRDLRSGVIKATLTVNADIGGGPQPTMVQVLSVVGGEPPLILVLLGNGSSMDGVAVYSWAGPTAVAEMPHPNSALRATSPNPMSRTGSIQFALTEAGSPVVDIYDATGRHVRHLTSDRLAPGAHQMEWDGTDDDGRRLAPSTYFFELKLGGLVVGTQKAVVLR